MSVRSCVSTEVVRGRYRRLCAVAVIGVVMLTAVLVPAGAQAATVKLTPFSGDYESGASVEFTANPGEVNQVTIRKDDAGHLSVRDDGARLTAQAGCVSLGGHSARCTGAIIHGSIALGDGNDRLTMQSRGPS